MKRFNITRVVTRDFFQDFLQGVRSLFGLRQVAYEKRISQTIEKMFAKIEEKDKILWYRINQDVIKDAVIITIYGEVDVVERVIE